MFEVTRVVTTEETKVEVEIQARLRLKCDSSHVVATAREPKKAMRGSGHFDRVLRWT